MNASISTKVLTQNNLVIRERDIFSFVIPQVPSSIIIFFILLTALSLIYVKDLNRRMFINLEQQKISMEQLQTNQGNLLLEQSAWSTQARVQQIAEQQLEMEIPTAAQVVMLREAV